VRAAIYARMSTDKQNEQSPDDQIAYCRRFAERQGWALVESLVVAEAGISSASRLNRPGLFGLVEQAALRR
jgi:site-specific DNA recombinase